MPPVPLYPLRFTPIFKPAIWGGRRLAEMFPGAPAACLKWLDLNEPEVLDRAATAGYCKDALFGRLTGMRATDPSDSSMPLGDGTGLGYSDKVLELTGLSHRRDLLAPVVAPLESAFLALTAAANESTEDEDR